MMLPNLAECVAKLQDMLRPEDERFGQGIADWTITCEYVDSLRIDGEDVWGCMGSPATSGLTKLTPEDVAQRRAHIAIRTPRSAAELAELWRTLFHEGGHVLVAELNLPRNAEEEVMHSLDNAFSKLSPEQATALARAIRNPMARAYRAPAKDGDMPDAIEDKDKKEPDKPPMAQDGGEVDAKAALDILAKSDGNAALEWMKAHFADKLDNALETPTAPAAPAPTPAPEMGMKPEESYARKIAEATKDAIEAIVEANPHLDEKQKAMARKQSTAKDARELVATYPRPVAPELPKLGMQGNPKTDPRGNMKPMARAMATASENPMLRKIMGVGTIENDGVHFEPQAGVLVYIDGTEQINHQAAMARATRAEKRGAA